MFPAILAGIKLVFWFVIVMLPLASLMKIPLFIVPAMVPPVLEMLQELVIDEPQVEMLIPSVPLI